MATVPTIPGDAVVATVPTIQKGTYRHTKTGGLYEVLGVALHTESNEYLVV